MVRNANIENGIALIHYIVVRTRIIFLKTIKAEHAMCEDERDDPDRISICRAQEWKENGIIMYCVIPIARNDGRNSFLKRRRMDRDE